MKRGSLSGWGCLSTVQIVRLNQCSFFFVVECIHRCAVSWRLAHWYFAKKCSRGAKNTRMIEFVPPSSDDLFVTLVSILLLSAASSTNGNGLIVVTVNYRLGVFGFLGSKQLSAKSSTNSTGNYGIADQRLALRSVLTALGLVPLFFPFHSFCLSLGGDTRSTICTSRVYIVCVCPCVGVFPTSGHHSAPPNPSPLTIIHYYYRGL